MSITRPLTKEELDQVREAFKTIKKAILSIDHSRSADPAFPVSHILSALRGPDNGDDYLKNLTTARIRAIVFPDNAVERGGCWITRSTPLQEGERKERDALLVSAEHHFRNHYRLAVESIRLIFGYDLWIEEKVGE